MSRTISLGSATITYPDRRVFAFSPYQCEISGLTESGTITIIFNNYSVKRYFNILNNVIDLNDDDISDDGSSSQIIDGNLNTGTIQILESLYEDETAHIVPLDQFFQSFFNNSEFGNVQNGVSSESMALNKEIIFSDGTNTAAMMFDIIWGALQMGETEPTEDYIFNFEDYPLVLTQTNGIYLKNQNDSLISQYAYGENFNLREYLDNNPDTTVINVQDSEYNTILSYNIVDECETDGYYLRWLDIYGKYRFYKLGFGSTDLESETEETFSKNVTSLNPVYTDLLRNRSVLKSKTVIKTINLGVSSSDDNLTTFLETVLTSLKQWLYVDGNWVELIPEDLTISRERNEGVREVSFDFMLPQYYTQSL